MLSRCKTFSSVLIQISNTDLVEGQDVINAIILDPQYAGYLAVLKAARNGAVYGAKVRFLHALV